ncbi:hypothetical protein ADM96_19500 [Burkholderia sp. ST111]|nr:hypothetical protein ADM96_19500 [Burkholderia sp. ST111]
MQVGFLTFLAGTGFMAAGFIHHSDNLGQGGLGLAVFGFVALAATSCGAETIKAYRIMRARIERMAD